VKDGCPFLASSFGHAKEEDKNSKCSFINSSFLFAQKRTKKGSQSLVPLSAESPVLLEITGRCETRPPVADSDSPRAFPVISSLLGCVKWQYKKQVVNLILHAFSEILQKCCL
jgi:hypothetical protein